jgi:hypothetical protein
MNSTKGLLYFLLLIFHVIPILITSLPTFDGPAHLHNSRLLLELISGNELIDSFFAINTESYTNWTDHAILSMLMLIFPAWITEKLLLLLIAIMIPVSIVHSVPKEQRTKSLFLSALSLPFVYNFLFGMGFWNFHIGLILAVLIFNYGYKKKFQLHTNGETIFLLLLILLLYFTHAFVFVFFVIAYTLGFITHVLLKYKKSTNNNWLLKQIIRTLLVFFVPVLILIYDFLQGKESLSGTEQMAMVDSLKMLISGKYLVYLNQSTELKIIPWYLIILGLFIIGVAIHRISTYHVNKTYLYSHDIFLLVSLITFMAFLIVPDRLEGIAGYLKYRLLLPFYLFLIIWISNHSLPKSFRIPPLTIYLLLHIWSINYYVHRIKSNYEEEIKSIKNIAQIIHENSVVLPVYNNAGWLRNHFSNYLGTDKPMVILENYEASSGSFPLTWNDEMPQLYLGSKPLRKGCRFGVEAKNPRGKHVIDYIFIYSYKHEKKSDCLEEYQDIIQEEYVEVETESERHKLLKYKGK